MNFITTDEVDAFLKENMSKIEEAKKDGTIRWKDVALAIGTNNSELVRSRYRIMKGEKGYKKKEITNPWLLEIVKNGEALKEERNFQSALDPEEELSQLEKQILKMQAKGINVTINYGGKLMYESKSIKPFHGGNPNNILVISDLHAPFVLDGYLKFCRETQEKYNCGTIIYIGDIVDFNGISYHEKTVEELNPTGEVAEARRVLKDWYYTFPSATVCMGNHDYLPRRKAKTIGLPREFIADPYSIFKAPSSYNFVDEKVISGVLYTHGSTSNAFKKCILEGMSMVSGHVHTQCGVMYHQNRHGQLRGMQVGVGIDYKHQAFDYAKSNSKNPVTACGVVLDSGKLPIVIPFIS